MEQLEKEFKEKVQSIESSSRQFHVDSFSVKIPSFDCTDKQVMDLFYNWGVQNHFAIDKWTKVAGMHDFFMYYWQPETDRVCPHCHQDLDIPKKPSLSK